MGEDEVVEGLAWGEGDVEGDEGLFCGLGGVLELVLEVGEGVEVGVGGDVFEAFFLHFGVFDEVGEIVRGGVDCLEVENVEEQGPVVVEEFPDCTFDQFRFDIC